MSDATLTLLAYFITYGVVTFAILLILFLVMMEDNND